MVGRDDDDSISAESDVSDDAASWETVEDDDGMVSHENTNEVCISLTTKPSVQYIISPLFRGLETAFSIR